MCVCVDMYMYIVCVFCRGRVVCVCVSACKLVCVHVHVNTCICLIVHMYSHSLISSPPYLSLSSYICTHQLLSSSTLSLQNGLTALEVARASTDRDWDEEEAYFDDEHSEWRRRPVTVVSDYDGVVDLLSGYTAEPAVLPSHPVSGTITTSSHYCDAVFCFNCTGTGQHSRPTGHHH